MAERTVEAEKLKIDAQFEKAIKDLTQFGTNIIQYCGNTTRLTAIKDTIAQLSEETEKVNIEYSTMNDGQSNQYYKRFMDTAENLVNTITTKIDSELEGFGGDK